MIRYDVKITGHEAPYKWEIMRCSPGASPFTPVNGRGQSDSYEDALFDAAQLARDMEQKRRHENTVTVETLFTVDDDFELGPSMD